MKIYSMTATFGKLEHARLDLKSGLNVLCAPNEWGKSTWCAFLIAMLYGLDTRAKTTRTALAEKERFAPWSGSPMEGRIDLNWNGRDITIERSTRGRVPLGVFRAYETDSGAEVPELTADNCGQLLLGVEQSVFRRTGFIRLSDLPVTQDEALRNRLNALVTTGDESGDAVRLAQELRNLKNKVRYNRSGLLPQAIAQRESLAAKEQELSNLTLQIQSAQQEITRTGEALKELENHKTAIAYEAALSDQRRVAEASETQEKAAQRLQKLESACEKLPNAEHAQEQYTQVRDLTQRWASAQNQARTAPDEPIPPETHPAFADMDGEDALFAAEQDAREFARHQGKIWFALWILGLMLFGVFGVFFWLENYIYAAAAGGSGFMLLLAGMVLRSVHHRAAQAIIDKYGQPEPSQWYAMARTHGAALHNYNVAKATHKARMDALNRQTELLRKQQDALCKGQSPETVLQYWQHITKLWEALENARRDAAAAQNHLDDVTAMARHCVPPEAPDRLTLSPAETDSQVFHVREQRQHLYNRLAQLQSRAEALGSAQQIRRDLDTAARRVQKLEDTYAALTIAQETLADATAELQKRFAPRITSRAQELLHGLTEGRYDRLVISDDFTLRAGAIQEDTLHEALWRSDGTVDQLYLALRLAVSEELSPEAPLILDDALVRFDDRRMKAAMDILEEIAKDKQILLFTCQQREADYLNQ